ncbi:hypothetical protein R5W24_004502 [Gemmata sp. JC717]|uniref:hypothetical protein n=1 Tax=Gemmata algarum TaxID=2975278 RepID=UPI0021BA4546|nr:hypothetical protein [Gemmata algarum]MDY3555359.1 hypothetical protein [Gemmata algarum]
MAEAEQASSQQPLISRGFAAARTLSAVQQAACTRQHSSLAAQQAEAVAFGWVLTPDTIAQQASNVSQHSSFATQQSATACSFAQQPPLFATGAPHVDVEQLEEE